MWLTLAGIGLIIFDTARQQQPVKGVRGLRGVRGLGRGPTPELPPADGVRSMSVRSYEYLPIDQRVKMIKDQLVRDARTKEVISEARTILSGRCPTAKGGVDWCVTPKDKRAEVFALYDAIVNPNSPYAIRYTADHRTIDVFSSARVMRKINAGDCDEQVTRLGAWLVSVGFPVTLVVIQDTKSPSWSHIYLETEANGQRVVLDPTEPQFGPGWEVPANLVAKKKKYVVVA